jgi:hypothetical protein
MEIKVKAVEGTEEKSVQEIENKLLEKHEEKLNDDTPVEKVQTEQVQLKEETTPVEQTEVKETPVVKEEIETQSSELNEEDVLKFIGNRYGKEIKSLDELNQQREEEPLPEDVAKYLKYKKETGRGFDDFAKMQRNYEDYSFDEELDDEKQIRKIKLAKKKTIAKAKDFFAKQQELYKVPLESRGDNLTSSESAKELEDYRKYIAEAKTVQEQQSRLRELYEKKTNDLFSEFKGFEFTLDDKKFSFAPGDATELKSLQNNPQNFVKKFLGENGELEDAAGYHRSLAMAMHPEKFAKFFYEQGKSAAADETMKKLKNVNMSTRSAPEVTRSTNGLQIKSVTPPSRSGLRIRSKNK